MKISLITPARSNLKYLKWNYASLVKHKGNHDIEWCIADDYSGDGTLGWLQQAVNFQDGITIKAIRNQGPDRLGHTILYDKLINDVATHDVAMIWHADMYLMPGALDAIESRIKKDTIVSLTRIEPPLHPPGPEKVVMPFGTEPENFQEDKLLEWFNSKDFNQYRTKIATEGIFAPWAFFRSTFQLIGGHDPMYAPQSKEDSDIFNRFQLQGIKFVQTWDGYVYHMTSRGSRFNPSLTTPGTNSKEWNEQNLRSSRNFIRKWGSFVAHDQYLKPIIPHKYNMGLHLTDIASRIDLVSALEPYYDTMWIDNNDLVNAYIAAESKNLRYMDLSERVLYGDPDDRNQILITASTKTIGRTQIEYLAGMPEIISANQLETGESYDLGGITVNVRGLDHYESSLIKNINVPDYKNKIVTI